MIVSADATIVTSVLQSVSPNLNDYYTSKAKSRRLATTTLIVMPVQWCNDEFFFSNSSTVIPLCNTVVPFTSGETVYFETPSVNSQEFPLFVHNTNNGYHPVNENYAMSSANGKTICSSVRPVSARELAE